MANFHQIQISGDDSSVSHGTPLAKKDKRGNESGSKNSGNIVISKKGSGDGNPKTVTHMVTFSGKGLKQFAEKTGGGTAPGPPYGKDDSDLKIPFKQNNLHDTSLGTSLEENLELEDSELGDHPGPLVSNN